MNGSYTPSFMPPNWGANFGNPVAAPQVQPWDQPIGQNLYESGVPGGFSSATSIAGPGGPTGPAPWNTLQGALGGQYTGAGGAILGQQGWVSPVLGAGSALVNAFMGMKQYGLYKDQLAESKRQFGLNYDAQRQSTNTALEDRQTARVASNPGAYQSVGTYMQANGIKGG